MVVPVHIHAGIFNFHSYGGVVMPGDIVLEYDGSGSTGECLTIDGHFIVEIIVEADKRQVRIKSREVK